jgi:hypothetical protein
MTIVCGFNILFIKRFIIIGLILLLVGSLCFSCADSDSPQNTSKIIAKSSTLVEPLSLEWFQQRLNIKCDKKTVKLSEHFILKFDGMKQLSLFNIAMDGIYWRMLFFNQIQWGNIFTKIQSEWRILKESLQNLYCHEKVYFESTRLISQKEVNTLGMFQNISNLVLSTAYFVDTTPIFHLKNLNTLELHGDLPNNVFTHYNLKVLIWHPKTTITENSFLSIGKMRKLEELHIVTPFRVKRDWVNHLKNLKNIRKMKFYTERWLIDGPNSKLLEENSYLFDYYDKKILFSLKERNKETKNPSFTRPPDSKPIIISKSITPEQKELSTNLIKAHGNYYVYCGSEPYKSVLKNVILNPNLIDYNNGVIIYKKEILGVVIDANNSKEKALRKLKFLKGKSCANIYSNIYFSKDLAEKLEEMGISTLLLNQISHSLDAHVINLQIWGNFNLYLKEFHYINTSDRLRPRRFLAWSNNMESDAFNYNTFLETQIIPGKNQKNQNVLKTTFLKHIKNTQRRLKVKIKITSNDSTPIKELKKYAKVVFTGKNISPLVFDKFSKLKQVKSIEIFLRYGTCTESLQKLNQIKNVTKIILSHMAGCKILNNTLFPTSLRKLTIVNAMGVNGHKIIENLSSANLQISSLSLYNLRKYNTCLSAWDLNPDECRLSGISKRTLRYLFKLINLRHLEIGALINDKEISKFIVLKNLQYLRLFHTLSRGKSFLDVLKIKGLREVRIPLRTFHSYEANINRIPKNLRSKIQICEEASSRGCNCCPYSLTDNFLGNYYPDYPAHPFK